MNALAPAEPAAQESRADDAPLSRRFLAIRIADRACALRLADIAGLVADKKIVRAPTSDPHLIGVAGYRGQVLAVRDLQALCDCGRATAPRWLAVARVAPVAFAFAAFDRQIDADSDAELLPLVGADMRGVRFLLQTRDFRGPVIEINAFIAAPGAPVAAPSPDHSP
jgi:purine-binding chemotaxis protein CheW